MSRHFLTRVEATYALGLACSSQMERADDWVPDGADPRVACRDLDGVVYEATGDEALHCQILDRMPHHADDGWTVDAEWHAEAQAVAFRAEHWHSERA